MTCTILRNKIVIRWQLIETKKRKRILTEDLELVIIELPKALREEKDLKLKKWLMFLDDPNTKEVIQMSKDDKEIKEAMDELAIVSSDEHKRRIAELKEKAILDERSGLRAAREAGINQGFNDGRNVGLAEGQQQTLHEIARKLLKLDMDIDKIAEITGLSRDEINEIKIAGN